MQAWFHKAIKGWEESLRELLKAKLHRHVCLAHLVGWNPTFQWFFEGTFLNFFEATSGSVVPILRKLNPCEFKNPRYQFTFTMCGLPGSLTTQFTCWRSNFKKSCLVSPESKHRKSWTKIEMETQWNTFNRFWNIASVSDSNEFQRWANYYYFILLLLIFFHLENIITKISLVNERPYKMAKPASLYPGYQRFFFLACGWMFRCRPQADRPTDLRSKAGRSYESQFKELSDTGNRAWKVSGTHGRKRYKDVKNNCLNARIQRCVWLTVLQTKAWKTASVSWIRMCSTKKDFTKVNLPYTG